MLQNAVLVQRKIEIYSQSTNLSDRNQYVKLNVQNSIITPLYVASHDRRGPERPWSYNKAALRIHQKYMDIKMLMLNYPWKYKHMKWT